MATTIEHTVQSTLGSSNPEAEPRHHEHQQPPPPVPNTHRRSSFSFSLPTPGLVGSIAEGAHYAGGLQPVHSSQVEHENSEQHVKHRRPEQLGSDDPAVEEVYRSVIEDLQEVYCGRVTLDILRRRFKRDAVFEDPLCVARGWDQYAAQWFALPKVITKSERTSFRIITATVSPNRLIFEQTQVYTFKFIGLTKVIPSVVIVDLDDDFRITRLEDQWYGSPLPKRWGASFLRKLNAKVTPWIFRVPKDNA
ncbi:hypothetical protein QCA50_002768 [Cerrena zonata]|uniref:Uncharacterized protein n=1 Tax=Cerrena zonata TaxID=2478898 RepID=A0AAW0GKL6_9APHY